MAGPQKSGGGEDIWAAVKIGHRFPENPVRVKGQINSYVCIWYQHGRPVCGRAWNHGGRVDAAFAVRGKVLTGAQLSGGIQILTNPAGASIRESFEKRRMWYEWVPFKERDGPGRTIVRCGTAAPILDAERLGHLDLATEIAYFVRETRVEEKRGELGDSLVLVRTTRNPPSQLQSLYIPLKAPPTAPTASYSASGSPSSTSTSSPANSVSTPPVLEDHWMDKRVMDQFPGDTVLAMGRPLVTRPGEDCPPEQHVALWFHHDGSPVLGRCWIGDHARIHASFATHGREFTGKSVGSIQVLTFTCAFIYGYEYAWRAFGPMREGRTEEWTVVSVGGVAPCVLRSPDGFERLGQVKLKSGIASVGRGGKEELHCGQPVNSFHVLCRRPSDGLD